MSMLAYVIGFHPPDEEWRKMKRVYDACVEAGTDVPAEVEKFFGYEEPDERGVTIDQDSLEKSGALTEWRDGDPSSTYCYEVEVAKLRPNVTHIRFFNNR